MRCLHCGQDFSPTHHGAKLCSYECKRAREKERLHRKGQPHTRTANPKRRRDRLSPEEAAKRDARIVAAIRDGVPTSAIIERFRVSKEYIYETARRAGQPLKAGCLALGSPT